MSKVRVVYKDDGGVAVIYSTPKPDRTFDEQCEKAMAQNSELVGRDYDDIDKVQLPSERKYREAWTRKLGGGIDIDIDKKALVDGGSLPKGGPIPEEDRAYSKALREEMVRIAKANLEARG